MLDLACPTPLMDVPRIEVVYYEDRIGIRERTNEGVRDDTNLDHASPVPTAPTHAHGHAAPLGSVARDVYLCPCRAGGTTYATHHGAAYDATCAAKCVAHRDMDAAATALRSIARSPAPR